MKSFKLMLTTESPYVVYASEIITIHAVDGRSSYQYLLLTSKGIRQTVDVPAAENQPGRCGGTITQLMSSDIYIYILYMCRSVGEGMEAAASLR